MKRRRDNVLRLKGVLMRDKSQIPDGFTALVARDVQTVLEQYFEIADDKVACTVSIDDDGEYSVRLQANASRLKNLPIII